MVFARAGEGSGTASLSSAGGNEAGEGLPADFPREEFTEDQLVLLDEYYHAKREDVVKQFSGCCASIPAAWI